MENIPVGLFILPNSPESNPYGRQGEKSETPYLLQYEFNKS